MTVMTLEKALACIEQMVLADIPSYLHGPPGTGKSQGFCGLAKRMRYGFLDFRATQREPVDVRGLPWIDPVTQTTRWLAPAELPQVERDGEKGILFIDELSDAMLTMQSSLYSLIQERRVGEYKLPPGWVPCAAGNRKSDRAAAQRLSTALKNRFGHYEVGADHKGWCEWAAGNGLPHEIIAFIRMRPELIHKMPEADQNSFPTPRSWDNASKFIQQPKELRVHLVASLVGDGPAAELEGFLRIYAQLPDIQQILTDPDNVVVPSIKEPAALYAVAGAIARHATAENFENVLKYAARLPQEFEVLAAVDAVKRNPSLKNSAAFARWAVKTKDVVI